MLTNLANFWGASGKRVCVISIDGTREDFFSLSDQVEHIVLDVTGPSFSILKLNGLYMSIKRIAAIRKSIKKVSPDVVVSFLGEVNILALLATRGLNTRMVISERNDPAIQNLGFGWDYMRRKLYKLADVVSANTRGAIETMRNYVPEDKLFFVPNPLAEVRLDTSIRKKKEILTVGSLRHQKAHDVLLKACQQVFKDEPNWSLTIVGDGECWSDLHELADQLGIEDKVCWLGRVEPHVFYQRAQIFVLPSRHEGTPNALLEAMNYGLPVIVSNASPGPLEYVKHNETGIVVPVEDFEALSQAILRLIRSRDLRLRLKEAASAELINNHPRNAMLEWETALGIA